MVMVERLSLHSGRVLSISCQLPLRVVHNITIVLKGTLGTCQPITIFAKCDILYIDPMVKEVSEPCYLWSVHLKSPTNLVIIPLQS